MIQKPSEIEIPAGNPFENDQLDRGVCAENLTALLESTEESIVLSVNAPWGMGKTTFIKMWQKYLEERGYFCIYFNAWKNDFAEKPLISFIAEIEGQISDKFASSGLKEKIKSNVQLLKTFGGKLISSSIPLATKIITSGLVKNEDIASFIEEFTKNQIQEFQESRVAIEDFKKSLQGLTSKVAEEIEGAKPSIIFFVDELDRCRPSYAIELLENVKHLFDVAGIHFVLGVDRSQLSHMVRTIYGSEMDADGYLRRFIDYEYQLPLPTRNAFCLFLYREFKLANVFDKRKNGESESESMIVTFSHLSEGLDISLRAMAQYFNQINIAVRITPYENHLHAEYLAFLIVLKNKREDLFSGLNENKETERVLEFIEEKLRLSEFLLGWEWATIKAKILCSFWDRSRIKNFIDENKSKGEGEKLDKENQKMENLLEQIKCFGMYNHDYNYDIHKYVMKKIELSEHFPVIKGN